ncbi:MAG: hypothetical protein LBU37_03580 [Tannerellaceae bacterium]|nr:hypothetical protein [Tannerellaceae bacterium]
MGEVIWGYPRHGRYIDGWGMRWAFIYMLPASVTALNNTYKYMVTSATGTTSPYDNANTLYYHIDGMGFDLWPTICAFDKLYKL